MGNVEQLIYNKLSLQQGVNLPGFGSLRVECRAAKFVSKTAVQAPYAQVVYSRRNSPRLDSIIDLMLSSSASTREQCELEYKTWLELELDQSVFNIEGVGTIKSDFFTPAPALEKMLNPFAGEIVGSKTGFSSGGKTGGRIGSKIGGKNSDSTRGAKSNTGAKTASRTASRASARKSEDSSQTKINRTIIWGAAGLVVVAAVAYLAFNSGLFSTSQAPAPAARPVYAEAEPLEVEPIASDTLVSQAADSSYIAVQPMRSQQVISSTEATTLSPYHVIAGMYSSDMNASMSIINLRAQLPDTIYYEKITRPSGKILISIYGSSSRSEAQKALEAFDIPGIWILAK